MLTLHSLRGVTDREVDSIATALGLREQVGVDLIRRQMEMLGEPLDGVPDAVVAAAALRLVQLLVRDPALGLPQPQADEFDVPDDE